MTVNFNGHNRDCNCDGWLQHRLQYFVIVNVNARDKRG